MPKAGQGLGSALWEHPCSLSALILVLWSSHPMLRARSTAGVVICRGNASAILPFPSAISLLCWLENKLPPSGWRERLPGAGHRARPSLPPLPLLE